MHVGKEVEGYYQGSQTLFCEASEVPALMVYFPKLHPKFQLEHVYVSDHEGQLTETGYKALGSLPVPVTVEVTRSLDVHQTRADNIRLMYAVRADPTLFNFAGAREHDQLKLTLNYHVATAKMAAFVTTLPEAFTSDRTLTLEDFK